MPCPPQNHCTPCAGASTGTCPHPHAGPHRRHSPQLGPVLPLPLPPTSPDTLGCPSLVSHLLPLSSASSHSFVYFVSCASVTLGRVLSLCSWRLGWSVGGVVKSARIGVSMISWKTYRIKLTRSAALAVGTRPVPWHPLQPLPLHPVHFSVYSLTDSLLQS